MTMAEADDDPPSRASNDDAFGVSESGNRFEIAGILGRLRGPWRIAVAERSMRPGIESGDWLLTDPTVRRWPRRGSVVVVREPETEVLALKRIVAGPGDAVRNVTVT